MALLEVPGRTVREPAQHDSAESERLVSSGLRPPWPGFGNEVQKEGDEEKRF